jgi:hypothetical protein
MENVMNKAEIICRFHQIADHLLLGAGNWPLSSERLEEFWTWVRACGLEEDVPDSVPGATRPSALGREMNLFMMMTFIGAFEIWEIPSTLESKGYITEAEADELWELSSKDGEALIQRYVIRAYLQFCNRTKLLS